MNNPITFDIKGQEYIRLNDLLKVLHLVGTGGEANMLISMGEVVVNDAIETRKRKKLRPGDQIEFRNKKILITG